MTESHNRAGEVVVGVPSVRRTEDERVEIVIGKDRVVRVGDAHPNPGGATSLLDDLAQRRQPAYLRLTPEGDEVAEVLVPTVVRVGRLSSQPGGGLTVELVPSHARHELVAGTPGEEEMRRLLAQSLDNGTLLVVTEDDSHRILDVRPVDPEIRLAPPMPVRTPLPEWYQQLLTFAWWSDLLDYLRWLLFPVSPAKARQVFDAVALLSCQPITVPAPCIPFRFPDDGCWGRAHEMCRLMTGMSVRSRKVWIQGWLQVSTRNHPNCEVQWVWHVAPTLRVRSGWWPLSTVRTWVVDPALFTEPVTQATWQSVQNDPSSTLTGTSKDIFWLWSSGTDPDNSQTEGVLATYRAKLQARAIGPYGPPPLCPLRLTDSHGRHREVLDIHDASPRLACAGDGPPTSRSAGAGAVRLYGQHLAIPVCRAPGSPVGARRGPGARGLGGERRHTGVC